jgi:hypothetical protein
MPLTAPPTYRLFRYFLALGKAARMSGESLPRGTIAMPFKTRSPLLGVTSMCTGELGVLLEVPGIREPPAVSVVWTGKWRRAP